MLRIFLANVWIFALLGMLTAQTSPNSQHECNSLLDRAKKSHAKGDYADAFTKYRAVKLCAPDKAAEVDKFIEKLFADVNNERQRADDARVEAENALSTNRRIIDNIFFYAGKFGLAYNAEKFGFIDKEGNTMINFDYVGARPFNELGFAWVHTGKDEVCIDTLGNEYMYADDLLNLTNQTIILELSSNDLPIVCTVNNQENSELQSNIQNLQNALKRRTVRKCLPDSIYKYTNLEVLILENIAEFPKGIAELPNLKILVCENCSELPMDISKCSKLEKILFTDSDITTLPNDFHKLKNLTTLDLSRNKASSFELPAKFYELPNLAYLNLASANLTNKSIEILSKLNKLKFLDLSENDNISNLPSNFFDEMPDLAVINLNAMEFTKLPNFQKLNKLEVLDISFTSAIQIFELDLAKHPHLQKINLYGLDDLSKCDIKGVSTSLISFAISSDSLTELPAAIINSPNIQELEIEGIKLDKFPNLIALPHLYKLTLHGLKKLTNVENLKKCSRLETLDISLCFSLFEKDMEFLGGFKQLKTLNLTNNAIKALPESINNLKKLQFIDLSINKLTSIPTTWISACSKLRTLDLSGNNFPADVKARIKSEVKSCVPNF